MKMVRSMEPLNKVRESINGFLIFREGSCPLRDKQMRRYMKINKKNNPLGNRSRGVAAVEFALVMPVLLFLFIGMVEFGIMLFDQAVITNAAREGARWGVVEAAAQLPNSTVTSCGQVSSYAGTSCSGTYTSPDDACQVASQYGAKTLISLGGGASPAVIVSCTKQNIGSSQRFAIDVKVQYSFVGFGFGIMQNLLNNQQLNSESVMYYE